MSSEPAIRLRFVTCNDLVSRAIRGAEMGFPYSHVEAVTPQGSYLGAHYDGGVQARPVGYDKGEWTRELFVDLPASPEQAGAFLAFLVAQIGKPYDMGAIGDMAEGVLTAGAVDRAAPPSWICSELQLAALLAAGLAASAPLVRMATPRDVLFVCAALTKIGAAQTP